MSSRRTKTPPQNRRRHHSDLVGDPATEHTPLRAAVGAPPGTQGNIRYLRCEVVANYVSLWASMGLTRAVIADLVGIDKSTLDANYPVELADGGARALGKVAMTLFQKAVTGDTTSAIFYLKTKGRWSERQPGDSRDNPLIIEGRAHSPVDVAVALAAKLRSERAGGSPEATPATTRH